MGTSLDPTRQPVAGMTNTSAADQSYLMGVGKGVCSGIGMLTAAITTGCALIGAIGAVLCSFLTVGATLLIGAGLLFAYFEKRYQFECQNLTGKQLENTQRHLEAARELKTRNEETIHARKAKADECGEKIKKTKDEFRKKTAKNPQAKQKLIKHNSERIVQKEKEITRLQWDYLNFMEEVLTKLSAAAQDPAENEQKYLVQAVEQMIKEAESDGLVISDKLKGKINELITNINNRSNRIKELEEKLKLAEENNADLKNQNDGLQTENSGLKENVERLKQQQTQLEDQIASLTENVNLTGGDLAEKAKELEQQKSKLEQVNGELKLAEENNAKLQGENSGLKNENSGLKENVEQLTKELEELKKQNEVDANALKQQLDVLKNENEKLNEKVLNLNSELADRGKQITQNNESIRLLKEEIEGLKNDLNDRKKKISELNSENENKILEIADLSAENDQYKIDINDLNDKIRSQSVRIEELLNENKKLASDLSNSENAYNRANDQSIFNKNLADNYEELYKNLKEHSSKLETRTDELNDEVALLIKENNQLKDEIYTLTKKIENQGKIISDKGEEIKSRDQKISKLETELNKRDEALKNQSEELEDFLRKLQEAENAKDEALNEADRLNNENKELKNRIEELERKADVYENEVRRLQDNLKDTESKLSAIESQSNEISLSLQHKAEEYKTLKEQTDQDNETHKNLLNEKDEEIKRLRQELDNCNEAARELVQNKKALERNFIASARLLVKARLAPIVFCRVLTKHMDSKVVFNIKSGVKHTAKQLDKVEVQTTQEGDIVEKLFISVRNSDGTVTKEPLTVAELSRDIADSKEAYLRADKISYFYPSSDNIILDKNEIFVDATFLAMDERLAEYVSYGILTEDDSGEYIINKDLFYQPTGFQNKLVLKENDLKAFETFLKLRDIRERIEFAQAKYFVTKGELEAAKMQDPATQSQLKKKLKAQFDELQTHLQEWLEVPNRNDIANGTGGGMNLFLNTLKSRKKSSTSTPISQQKTPAKSAHTNAKPLPTGKVDPASKIQAVPKPKNSQKRVT